MFVPLVFATTSELLYDVAGSTSTTLTGRSSIDMRVRLARLMVRPSDGARLVRMSIDRDARLRDRHGSPHAASDLAPSMRYPFYWWQLRSGGLAVSRQENRPRPKLRPRSKPLSGLRSK